MTELLKDMFVPGHRVRKKIDSAKAIHEQINSIQDSNLRQRVKTFHKLLSDLELQLMMRAMVSAMGALITTAQTTLVLHTAWWLTLIAAPIIFVLAAILIDFPLGRFYFNPKGTRIRNHISQLVNDDPFNRDALQAIAEIEPRYESFITTVLNK